MKTPETVEEVQQIVRETETPISVLGSTHSFNDIADAAHGPEGTLISLAFLRDPEVLDAEAMTVTCHGGVTYGQLARYLAKRGAALKNMPSLPHVTVAGAIATGTHGSGITFGNMSSQVAALEIVGASGDVVRYSREDTPHHLDCAAVSLGLLGVVTRVTLDIVPTYDVDQIALKDLPLKTYLSHLEDFNQQYDSVSAFVDFSKSSVEYLWLRNFREQNDHDDVNDKQDTFSNLQSIVEQYKTSEPVLFFESGQDVRTTFTAPWDLALPFFTSWKFPAESGSGRDTNMPNLALHSEYFVDINNAVPALEAVREVARHWPGWGAWDGVNASSAGPVIMNETRFVRGDSFWLSPCRGRDSVAIHFTFNSDEAAVLPLVSELEEALREFSPRPHWGKLYTMSPEDLRSAYTDEDSLSSYAYVTAGTSVRGDAVSALRRFEKLREELDPNRKFSSSPFARSKLPLPLCHEQPAHDDASSCVRQ